MAFGNFKETNETNENKESSVDNTEKPKNQILETPKDYEDDFDKKVDAADKKESKENGGENKRGGIGGFIDRMIDTISSKKEKESVSENEDLKAESSENGKTNKFKDSLKFDVDPKQMARVMENFKNGVTDNPRPKGGVERERGEEDPRVNAYNIDNGTENKSNKNNEI